MTVLCERINVLLAFLGFRVNLISQATLVRGTPWYIYTGSWDPLVYPVRGTPWFICTDMNNNYFTVFKRQKYFGAKS